MKRSTGKWLTVPSPKGDFKAFLPNPLPPDPPLNWEPLLPLLSRADLAIGRLDGICSALPNSELFLSMYVRREAVLSSQIEGTQSSLSDLLLFENQAPAVAAQGDVAEVSRQAQPVFAGGFAPAASRWSAPPGRSGTGRVGRPASVSSRRRNGTW